MNYYYDNALSFVCVCALLFRHIRRKPQMIPKINGEFCLANCDTDTHTHRHTSSEAEGNNSGDEKGVVENPTTDPRTPNWWKI